MLAGEKFSDHPATVSPVIAAFLRTYNDGLDDRRRQDLHPLASLIVARPIAGGSSVSGSAGVWSSPAASEPGLRIRTGGQRSS